MIIYWNRSILNYLIYLYIPFYTKLSESIKRLLFIIYSFIKSAVTPTKNRGALRTIVHGGSRGTNMRGAGVASAAITQALNGGNKREP
jgi:hypothetical protein